MCGQDSLRHASARRWKDRGTSLVSAFGGQT
jgi:hypothetical protein